MRAPKEPVDPNTSAGKTLSIGQAMYTEYLLPVEIVGVLLMMAIIGAVILARKLNQPQIELVVDREMQLRKEGEYSGD
jgi:NADH:ubiquinone oxidoreductase subunit 6 (subunit J)